MKILVVVDMQNDFIDGALGSKEAQAIVPNVVEKIRNFDGNIIFTQDTHFESSGTMVAPAYSESLEGKLLPVPHCMIDKNGTPTVGHFLNKDIDEVARSKDKVQFIRKFTFGCTVLPQMINSDRKLPGGFGLEPIESIEICGLCTDICVVSNALILRASYPDVPMKVDSKCCAGVTPEKHEAALEVMRSCQIEVI